MGDWLTVVVLVIVARQSVEAVMPKRPAQKVLTSDWMYVFDQRPR